MNRLRECTYVARLVQRQLRRNAQLAGRVAWRVNTRPVIKKGSGIGIRVNPTPRLDPPASLFNNQSINRVNLTETG